jgi:hypothetical protein
VCGPLLFGRTACLRGALRRLGLIRFNQCEAVVRVALPTTLWSPQRGMTLVPPSLGQLGLRHAGGIACVGVSGGVLASRGGIAVLQHSRTRVNGCEGQARNL